MKITEILDNNLNIQSKNDKPVGGDNLETMADKTTDYNAGVARQDYNDNFMGLFGFYFFENDSIEPNKELIDIFAKLHFDRYKEMLDYFIKNVSKDNILDWKKTASTNFDKLSDKDKETDYKWAKKTIDSLMDYLKSQYDTSENEKKINEDIVTKNDNDLILKEKIKLTLSDIKNENVRNAVKKLINTIRKEGDGINVEQLKDIMSNINDVVESKIKK
jgi:hypothetical protein